MEWEATPLACPSPSTDSYCFSPTPTRNFLDNEDILDANWNGGDLTISRPSIGLRHHPLGYGAFAFDCNPLPYPETLPFSGNDNMEIDEPAFDATIFHSSVHEQEFTLPHRPQRQATITGYSADANNTARLEPSNPEPKGSQTWARQWQSHQDKARGHSAMVWESYKDIIKRLYLEEGRSLNEVINIMRQEHKFTATAKMYKSKFARWSFNKNNTKKDVSLMLWEKLKRDGTGKRTEFNRNGKRVNLHQYLKRKGVTEIDDVEFHDTDRLPSYIRCKTPPAPDLPLEPPVIIQAQLMVMRHLGAFFRYKTWPQRLPYGSQRNYMAPLRQASYYFQLNQLSHGWNALHSVCRNTHLYSKDPDLYNTWTLIFHLSRIDSRVLTLSWRCLASVFEVVAPNGHPLRPLFTYLYHYLLNHGQQALKDLVEQCQESAAEEFTKVCPPDTFVAVKIWLSIAKNGKGLQSDRLSKFIEYIATQIQLYSNHDVENVNNLWLQSYLLRLWVWLGQNEGAPVSSLVSYLSHSVSSFNSGRNKKLPADVKESCAYALCLFYFKRGSRTGVDVDESFKFAVHYMEIVVQIGMSWRSWASPFTMNNVRTLERWYIQCGNTTRVQEWRKWLDARENLNLRRNTVKSKKRRTE